MLVWIPQHWKFQGYNKSLKFFNIGKGGEIIIIINVIKKQGGPHDCNQLVSWGYMSSMLAMWHKFWITDKGSKTTTQQ
jgi:hypothetical protein